MEVMEPLGYMIIFGQEYFVFKVIGVDVYYYENQKNGKIIKVDMR